MHFNKGIFVVLILLAVILVSGCTQTYDVNRTGTELIKAKPSITITSKCLLDPQPCKNADSIQATFAVDDSELWNQTNTGILKIQIKDKPATPFTIDIGDSRIVGLTDNTGKATLTVCDELLVKGLYSDCAGNAKIPKSGQLTLTYKIYSSSDYLSSIFSKTEAVKIPDRPPLSTTSPRTVTQSPSTSPIIIVTASPTPTQKPVVVGDVFLMNMRIPEVFPDICNKEGTVATLEFIAPNQTGYTYTLKQLTFFEEGTVPKNATGPYKLYKNGELVSTTTIKPTSEIIFETFISPFTLTGGQKLDNITVKTSVVSASGDKVTKISLEGAKISATPPGGQTAEFSLKADKIVSSFAQRPEKIKKCPPDIV